MLHSRSHPAPLLPDRTGRSSRPVGTVALLGVVSAALYGVVYAMQRAMFRNGLRNLDGIPLQAGTPASAYELRWQVFAYAAATLLLFVLYGRLLLLCRRGAIDDPRARRLALLFPVLINLALLFGRPYLSIDLWTYLAHGYIGTLPSGSPYIVPASAVSTSAFGDRLSALGWLPVHAESPYGPLWTRIELLAFRLTPDLGAAMLLLKALVVAASLVSAALIWTILGRVNPDRRLLGTLLYLWNPLVIVEFAAEGHNDALMIACVLGALALAVTARPAASLVVLAVGILIKYLPLLLLPALLVYLWRNRLSGRRLAQQLLLGSALSAVLAVLAFAPLWVGRDTFQGLRATGQPDRLPSPAGLVYTRLSTQSPGTAATTTQLLVGAALALVVAGLSLTVRGDRDLLRVCGVIALVYTLGAVPGYYWPWYAAFPLALLALSPGNGFVVMAFVLSVCGRVVAPIADLANNGFMAWPAALPLSTAIGMTLPLVIALLLVGGHLVNAMRPRVPRARDTTDAYPKADP